MKHHLLPCSCGSCEHQAILFYEPDDKEAERELWVEVHLRNYRSILQRVWIAIRYIFGYKCRYGNWDTISLFPPQVKELKSFLSEYLDTFNDQEIDE